VLCIYLQITVNNAFIFFQFKQVGKIFKIIAFQLKIDLIWFEIPLGLFELE